MSAENKTHEQIVAEVRFHAQQNIDAEKDKPEFGILTAEGKIALNYADELEAAHKREVEKLNSVIQATVSRSDAEIDRLRREAEELRKQIGNSAKLREAIAKCVNLITEFGNAEIVKTPLDVIVDIEAILKAALAEPPRQCDVGTEQEQQDRFREFCRHYEREGECGIGRSEAACPAFQGGRNPDCSLWWAQMPYDESEAVQ